MPVTINHRDYSDMLATVQLVRDCVEGDPAIKRRTTEYLPAGFAKGDDGKYTGHYKEYLSRAYFMGVTGRTKDALTGMVFRKAPTHELPTEIEALLEDIDGAGQSLEQIAKQQVGELMEAGKHYLLVDYPRDGEGVDAETERRLGLRPTIAPYPFESLINWRFEGIRGRQMLTLAVLKETVDVGDDEFAHDTENRYRVLRLRDGVYTQQIYNDFGAADGEEYAPRMAGGETFDHIPLHIAGAKSNLPGKDMPPLYDIARVNIGHYQNTANTEESGYVATQPMIHIDTGDTSATEWKEVNPGPVTLGNRNGLITQGGRLDLVQAQATDYNLTLMERKESQMVMLGARLVQRGGQAETAEASRINASAEASALDVLVGNASECIEAALEDVARFIGADPGAVSYGLNRSFWESSLSSGALQAVIQGYQTGAYGPKDVLYMIRKGQIQLDPEREDEEILEDAVSSLIDRLADNGP